MSFDYIIEKENVEVKLLQEEKENLVKTISDKFKIQNSERTVNMQMASDLANEIFFKNDFKNV